MNRIRARHLAFVLAAALLAPAPSPAQARGSLDDSIERAASSEPYRRVVAWVRFRDRAGAEHDPAALVAEAARRPAKGLARRVLRGSLKALTADDLPVHGAYVAAIAGRGLRVRGTSRWLNAASVEGPAGAVAALARLSFVAAVEPVERARSLRPVDELVTEALAPAPFRVAAPGDTAYYGATFKQLSMMQAPAAHAAGLDGSGVLVCVLDSGFRTTHEIFSGLSVVATRDFVHGDLVVDDQVGQDPSGAGSHGTQTLACIAGHKPGVFVGGAYAAAVALGKTEDVATETPVEMDAWQFGAEWADSLGADVLSSSLGYFLFDSPHASYGHPDMDGKTTTVTQAASMAMRRGIVVVTAIGNERGSAWDDLIAPADADTVISVGAVDSFNVLASFSSPGPTADGRIKPDVSAMGRRVYLPSFTTANAYTRLSGTSFATPLVAGMAALVLQAHPTWDPFAVREALRGTALNAGAPNNDIGWGLVQVQAAAGWLPSTTGVELPGALASGPGALALAAGPNPFTPGGGVTSIRFAAPGAATLDAYDVHGRHVARLFSGDATGGRNVAWSGVDARGTRVPAGVYWLRLAAPAAVRTLRIVAVR